jgi:hypothetical protein
MKNRDRESKLATALRARGVMTLEEVRSFLGGVSQATAFRCLGRVPYRTSYNRNARFYTFHDERKYDRHGIWSHEGVHFSRDGALTATVRRLVAASAAGQTQRELQELLGVGVQNVLAALLRRSELTRERIGKVYVYLDVEEEVRRGQARRRLEELARQQARAAIEVPLKTVVEILLVLIRHPESDAAAVARRLRSRSPPISIDQIRSVFERYGLDEKRGLSTS